MNNNWKEVKRARRAMAAPRRLWLKGFVTGMLAFGLFGALVAYTLMEAGR